MPNWCHNRVTIEPDENEDLHSILDLFDSPNPFNALIPEPDWRSVPNEQGIYPGPRYGPLEPLRFPDGTPDQRWYSWRLANWGVKWDIRADHIEWTNRQSHYLEFEFETPWGPPEKICQELRNRGYSVTWFYDEPAMQDAGYL